MAEENEGKDGKWSESAILVAAALLGGAAGAKIADDLVGGRGLPTLLAQVGGAVLGAVGGNTLARAVLEDGGDSHETPG